MHLDVSYLRSTTDHDRAALFERMMGLLPDKGESVDEQTKVALFFRAVENGAGDVVGVMCLPK
jgi:hypothetical protein